MGFLPDGSPDHEEVLRLVELRALPADAPRAVAARAALGIGGAPVAAPATSTTMPAPAPALAPEPSEPLPELPAELFKVRLCVGPGSILHVLTRQPPLELHADAKGHLDLTPWDPVESDTASDVIVFLKADAIAGITYRRAASPRRVAEALDVQRPDPELTADPTTLIECPADGCTTKNIPRRRQCRRCGCSLAKAKPKAKRRRDDAGEGEAPKPRARRRGTQLRQCKRCGAHHEGERCSCQVVT